VTEDFPSWVIAPRERILGRAGREQRGGGGEEGREADHYPFGEGEKRMGKECRLYTLWLLQGGRPLRLKRKGPYCDFKLKGGRR